MTIEDLGQHEREVPLRVSLYIGLAYALMIAIVLRLFFL